jgi:glutathione S-transferase
MAELVIYGNALSNYVRSARLACAEKGVAYTLQTEGHDNIAALRSPEHRALHPFARMPAMRHGEHTLYEAQAIMRYVDEAFDGPALQPADAYGRGLMSQWMSATNDYLNASFRAGIVINYVFPSGDGGKPDMAAIEAAAKAAGRQALILDAALAENEFLAGDSVSLADLLLLPILLGAWRFPEGRAVLEPCANIGRWYQAMASRPSMAATDPEKVAA